MGAANVVRLGPLRIAGMSGIWKGYDYRKVHGERIPYSYEEISTIYHTREIDVRKLLHLRTQVDIGLSHDWPRGIEGFGDTVELFRKKGHLRDDSTHGTLGSQAAREVLDYLRPAFWFSAHLHVKYLAAMPHDATLRRIQPGENEPIAWAFEADPKTPVQAIFDAGGQPTAKPDMAGWNHFGAIAHQNEGATAKKYRDDWEAGKRADTTRPAHKVAWKKPDGTTTHLVHEFDDKKLDAEKQSGQNNEEIELDSSSSSNGGSTRNSPDGSPPAKRRSPNRSSPANKMSSHHESATNKWFSDRAPPTSEDPTIQQWSNFGAVARENEGAAAQEIQADWEAGNRASGAPSAHKHTWTTLEGVDREVSEYVDGVNKLALDNNSTQNENEIELASSTASSQGSPPGRASHEKLTMIPSVGFDGASSSRISQSLVDRAVAQGNAVRTKLPSAFAPPPPPSPTVAKRTSPPGVTNRLTKFMALDKPKNRDPYVELVVIKPTSELTDSSANSDGRFRLQYDKEWLAITRAFADDLELGTPNARVPPRPTEKMAFAAIHNAENWIEENVVQKGLMDIPLNFCAIAPVHDPNSSVMNPNMPMEYPNNQTEDFCNLIGIKNKFALTEERTARMEAGPRISQSAFGDQKHRGKRAGRGRGGRGGGKRPKTFHPSQKNPS